MPQQREACLQGRNASHSVTQEQSWEAGAQDNTADSGEGLSVQNQRFYLRHPRISHQNFKKGVTWLDLHFPRPLWLPVEDGTG